MSDLRQNIPAGKTRVIGVDLFDHGNYPVNDYDNPGKAFEVADKHNNARSGEMDDVYYVYNDKGEYLRGPEDVSRLGVSP